ncbi:MAG: bifunctional 3-deoxy-7-phosphoheptulonate synthase/chorismate mutase type II [Bacteroidales bacterium]|nr:bifunctional 3-deoxy-7-phosphoheptulonate synthase/chorismate mutase type II [Bacteroidales bacterium]MBN2818257.1 bifunctional 3-deoxy-7-phosphoheptulonate synthase/chorismate mutase type II [Bacteroidales bacterium]
MKLELEKFTFPGVGEERPLVMAGPCSAETEEQVMETARQLKENGINIFRAGIWKPRTRPNTFEGVGKEGLPWLKKVHNELGMLTATEVANANHVFEALKYGVDILWIGARTTANPFAVQEIADALEGVDIPVLIKNPVNPDVELWIGAFERLNQAGIKKLAAIHRGFSTYGKTFYRNDPQWQIPIELKRRIPDLPMITDPSHICGNRELLFEISQEAMDLNFDGLIIESHICPDKAISDAGQQITPKALKELLDKLVLRKPNIENTLIMNSLEDLRQEIDKYDDKLLDILASRMMVAEKIGLYKKEHNLTILQSGRWDELLQERTRKAMKKGLSEEFIIKVLRAIHQESINRQTKIMNE